MTKIKNLQPGDKVEYMGVKSVFLSSSPHPIYPGLSMVLWKFTAHPFDLSHSIDALSPEQEIDGLVRQSATQRYATLVEVLNDVR